MTPDRWQQISRLFDETVAQSADRRAAFLVHACAGDEALRREVESLLARGTGAIAAPLASAEPASAATPSWVGRTVGSYMVSSRLGAGGMGEVYRARDARLGRDVAIKVLPRHVTSSPDRLARLKREARLLATLNDPHIGAIYGFEESDDGHALVLELVDGDTLADRIEQSRGRGLGFVPALDIARQIASALDAAHEKGIIHRDLKPANVMITPAGVVKVLDFGLGKSLLEDADADASLRAAADTAGTTREGLILGTPAYMSPEQARGQPVDKRSDIWAFGCVLYELLSGQRAFKGEGVADTLSAVLQREPDYTALAETTPLGVRRLLVRCLEKDRNKRLPQIAVAAFQIDELVTGDQAGAVPSATPRRTARWGRLPAAAAVAGAIAGALIVWWAFSRPSAVAPVSRLHMSVSPADELGGGIAGRPTRTAFVLSTDGRTVIFSALENGRRALYMRPLDQAAATMIPATDDAVGPFLSPDGGWVGFWAAGQIRKAPLQGGPSVLVLPAPQIFGASWGSDDRIVFARGAGGLLEVSSAGGSASELTALNNERGEVSHRLPHVLPGGDAVLYTVAYDRFPRWDETEIWLYSRATGTSRRLLEGGADARYVPSGHLLYVREGALLVVPFDLSRKEVTGGPVGVLTDVMQAAYIAGQPNDSGAMQASVSASGTLVYVTGGVQAATDYSVVQVDRSGRAEPLPIPVGDFRTLRMSPDGTRLAVGTVGRDRSIWLYGFERGTFSKLAAAGRSTVPVWTPSGDRITYGASNRGPNNLHQLSADGGGVPELLVPSPRNLEPATWTANGRELLYYEIPDNAAALAGGTKLWAKDVTGDTPPRSVPGAFANVAGADVSPDGKWLAYHSGESRQFDVFVDAYPGPGPRVQVSTNGGGSPIWRADGRELFYVRSSSNSPARGAAPADVDMMAVNVTMQGTLRFGPPRKLFSGRYSMNGPARGYDVSGDGQRFLLLHAREHPPDVITQLNVVQNWIDELRDKRD